MRIANSVEGGSLHWRLLIVAEPESRFTLIEEYTSAAPDLVAYSNAAVEIVVQDAAKVEYVSVQNLRAAPGTSLRTTPVSSAMPARLGRRWLRLREGEDSDSERPCRTRCYVTCHRCVFRRWNAAPRLRHVPGAHRAFDHLDFAFKGASRTRRVLSGAG